MDRRESRRTIVFGAGLLALVLAALGVSYLLNGVSERQRETNDELAQWGIAPTVGVMSNATTLPMATPTQPVPPTQRSENAATQEATSQATVTPRSKGSSWAPGDGTPFEPRVRPTEPAVPPDVPPAGTTATPQPPINTNGVGEMRRWIKGDRPDRAPYYNAYINYWQITSEAYRTGDTSQLGGLMTGNALDEALKMIAERRSQGRGVETRIRTKSFTIVELKPDSFSIQHQYINASVYVDLKKGKPTATHGPSDASMYKQLTVLRKVDGVWKVSSINLTQIPAFTP